MGEVFTKASDTYDYPYKIDVTAYQSPPNPIKAIMCMNKGLIVVSKHGLILSVCVNGVREKESQLLWGNIYAPLASVK